VFTVAVIVGMILLPNMRNAPNRGRFWCEHTHVFNNAEIQPQRCSPQNRRFHIPYEPFQNQPPKEFRMLFFELEKPVRKNIKVNIKESEKHTVELSLMKPV